MKKKHEAKTVTTPKDTLNQKPAGDKPTEKALAPYFKDVDIVAVVLNTGKGLFTRFHSDGSPTTAKMKGKMFFPHRDCPNEITTGLVHVTSVKESTDYGFFMGEMVKSDVPAVDHVLSHIRRRLKYASQDDLSSKLEYIGNANGSFIRYHYGDKVEDLAGYNGQLFSMPGNTLSTDNDTVVATVSVPDFVVSNTGHAASFDDLIKKFHTLPLRALVGRKADLHESDPAELQDAVKYGMVFLRYINTVGSTVAFLDNVQILKGLLYNDADKMSAIIKVFNDINEKATATIQSKKLSLEALQNL
jgi:hypothetical protein